jgi:hypothetical protein
MFNMSLNAYYWLDGRAELPSQHSMDYSYLKIRSNQNAFSGAIKYLSTLVTLLSILFGALGTSTKRAVAFYTLISILPFGECGSQYITYWGDDFYHTGGALYSFWRERLKLYASFIVFWTMFKVLFMFAPVFFQIHMVVLRSNSSNREADEKNDKWL